MALFPLYHGLDAPHEPDPGSMNLGLWFERYFSGYERGFQKVSQTARSTWLRQLAVKELGSTDMLQAKARNIEQLATSQGGQTRIYQATAPFVTGMGNAHPLENGFTWHPTLGMPYLPGSAVKGLARAAVELAWQGEDKAATLKRWFGTEHKGDVPEASGCFIFLDALPVAPCALVPEVMTPHMGKWYEKGGKTPLPVDVQPGDWHNPVPVGYLTARGLQLQFAVLPRPGTGAHELDMVWQAIDYALQWLGAGAKTAQGFGAMQLDPEVEKRRRQQQAERAQAAEQARQQARRQAELQAMLPVERAAQECLDEQADPNIPATTAIFNALKADRWEGQLKRDIAAHLSRLMQAQNKWKLQSGKKNPLKDKDHQNTLQVQRWMEEG